MSHCLKDWNGLAAPGFPIIFHGVDGPDMREGDSPSWFNLSEAEVVADYVRKLRDGIPAVALHDIGVIVPYMKQVQKLQTLLQCKEGVKGVIVGSAETFQGVERKVIIISTVRSSDSFLKFDTRNRLGFLASPKRFNVAITRAQALLIVVGNPRVLIRDKYWGSLLRYCIMNVAYVGVPLSEDMKNHEGKGWQDHEQNGDEDEDEEYEDEEGEILEDEASGAFGESLRGQQEGPEFRIEM